MKTRIKIWYASFLVVLCCSVGLWAVPVSAAEGVQLFTPYTSLILPPGETIRYDVELINNTEAIQTINVDVDDGGHRWEYELLSGGRAINQIAVKPNESTTINFSLTVPLEVDKGVYTFRITAGAFGSLPLQVNVSEKGSYRSEFTVGQPNRQGHADSSFSYSLTLNNRTAATQQYALGADAPAGWEAGFVVDGTNVTAVEIEPNSSKSVTLNLNPPDNAKADTYRIAVQAAGDGTSADAEVEAVITGTYGIELATSDERLSAEVTAGGNRKLELLVKNTGTTDLTNVNLSSIAPANWEVSFEPKTIASIKPGQSTAVTATVKSSNKALAGDYVMNLSASSAEKSASASIRVTVKTSVLWGWVGVLIIVAVLAGIYGLFRKYGRR